VKKDSSYLWKALISLVSLTIFISCATIVGRSRPENLDIRSTPEQATVIILDEDGTKIFEGKTPTIVSLQKRKGFFRGKKYQVKIGKEGYTEQTWTVNTRVNGWYIAGNLFFGGLLGWIIVDPATGAMWTLDTRVLDVALNPSQQINQNDFYQFGIMLLDNVPQHLRDKMVKISQ